MRIFWILELLGLVAILGILATPVRAEKAGRLFCPTWAPSIFPHPLDRNIGGGLVRDGDRQTYISKGLGLFFVPIRLNCPADVSMLTLTQT